MARPTPPPRGFSSFSRGQVRRRRSESDAATCWLRCTAQIETPKTEKARYVRAVAGCSTHLSRNSLFCCQLQFKSRGQPLRIAGPGHTGFRSFASDNWTGEREARGVRRTRPAYQTLTPEHPPRLTTTATPTSTGSSCAYLLFTSAWVDGSPNSTPPRL